VGVRVCGSDVVSRFPKVMTTPHSSRDLLRGVFEDVAIANKLLKSPCTQSSKGNHKQIEFESLRFEEPEEEARLRALNLTAKLAPPALNQLGKMAYKNMSLWSSRSLTLEPQLRAVVNSSVETWPDYELLRRIAAASDDNPDVLNKLVLGVVDTIVVRLAEATDVKFGLDRICSPWSFTSEKFELTTVRIVIFSFHWV
jgi:hypothetical protein